LDVCTDANPDTMDLSCISSCRRRCGPSRFRIRRKCVAACHMVGQRSFIRSSAYYCEAKPSWLQCMLGCMGQTSSWSHAHQSICREPGRSIVGLLLLCGRPRNDECFEYSHQRMKRRLKPVYVRLSCEMDEPCCCRCKDVEM
jgi:hypothetical protein